MKVFGARRRLTSEMRSMVIASLFAIALVALAVVARFLLRASVGRHTTAE